MKQKEIPLEEKNETKSTQLNPNEKTETVAQPSYLGYLSGVISSLWAGPTLKEETPTTPTTTPSKAPEAPDRVAKVVVKKYSREEVATKTNTLVMKLLAAESTSSKILRVGELSKHLMQFPASRLVAVQKNKKLVPILLKMVETAPDSFLKEEAMQCLALCGYSQPPRGRGIRVLSIDGGGTRGILGLEVLDELEKQAGNKKICEMFDIIVGVSTGGILATLLGAKRKSVDECKTIYMEISRQLFNQGRLSGVSGLLLSHSYYNSKKWVEILKKVLGEDVMTIHTARSPKSPKLAVISSIVNAPQLQPFIFRNYELPPGRDSHFRGGTQFHLYEAVQCSSAAPGYFAEVQLGTVVHQDGGVLVNNPTAIAIHEARQIWPGEDIHCVVSVGNGRSVAELELSSMKTSTRIQDKISKIVDSATDTELVHLAMSDLLQPEGYFRLNPYMSFPYTLDEIDPDKLLQMRRDSLLYVRRNRLKIALAAKRLVEKPSVVTNVRRTFFEWKAHWGMYQM
ncbi:hypothetical protein FO519_007190 [Halicephalobus sp. NKZ332]|nr:hypothetical protein FO519_007190 [Halicephalobus sp. NKZ332]